MGSMRLGWALLGVSLCSFFAPRGAAAREGDPKQECLAAYEDAQRSRKRGELVLAAEKLNFCASPACPRAMQPDCEQWLREVEESVPTVVFDVRSQSGESLAGASLAIDAGEMRVLDGRALRMDPGEHELAFSAPGYEPLERRFLAIEGNKLQVQQIALAPLLRPSPIASADLAGRLPAPERPGPRPSAPTTSSRRTPLLVSLVASAALTLAGGAGFAYFGLRARSGDSALAACSPDCARTQIDRVKQDYLFANIAFGATTIGGLATGTLFVISRADAGTTSSALRSTLRIGPTMVWTTAF
jgi:hypothetical protein